MGLFITKLANICKSNTGWENAHALSQSALTLSRWISLLMLSTFQSFNLELLTLAHKHWPHAYFGYAY